MTGNGGGGEMPELAGPEPADHPAARAAFAAELDQLRLQVEVMAMRVGESLERMREVLASGDRELAMAAVAADDDIDAMHVSLTGRVYDLICRQQPVASDLRFLVSVLRIVEEVERIGDLSLRVVKQHPSHDVLMGHPGIFATLQDMSGVATDVYRLAVEAWTGQDLEMARALSERTQVMDEHYGRLSHDILDLEGPDAARTAVAAVLVGRALERIADHTVIVGERLWYLLTGDPAWLAAEVR